MAWEFTNDRPVYLQIMDVIQKRIISGQYKAGDKLPAVRELAEEAQVNPNTMQKALSELEREQLIFAQRTSGRFVTYDDKRILQLRESRAENVVCDFMEQMTELGYGLEEIVYKVNNFGGEEE